MRHANGTDYWVVTHLFGNDAFYAYQVGAGGVGPTVISFAGIIHDSLSLGNSFGQIKFSPCGDKLAIAAGYKDTVEVLDFDAATGIVSNPLSIPFSDHVYGIEFSHDGSMLYVSNYNPDTSLVQFDLTLSTPSAILASRYGYATTSQVFGLQLGPDSNIYVARSFIQYLGVINDPEMQGAAANFFENGFDLDPNGTSVVQGGLGLTGFVKDFLPSGCGVPSATRNPEQSKPIAWWTNPSGRDVELHADETCHIRIFNTVGALVFERQMTGSTSIQLEQGVYLVSVQKRNVMRTGRLIVLD
jgi:hypothetical protein